MEESTKQQRKQYDKKGEKKSRMVSFRADENVCQLLSSVSNKGRLLNDLVTAWGNGTRYQGNEQPPKQWSIEDYM